MSSLPDLTYHCSGSHWLAPGVAPAELRASMIPGDEDAVRRVGRRGREIVQDRQVDALEFVDLPVVGGLAVEPGAVDFPGHVLHARVSCGDSRRHATLPRAWPIVAFPASRAGG